jgi:hypothetical protein
MCLHRGSAKCEFEKREARSQSQAAGGKTYRRVSGLFRSVPCPVRAAPLAAVIPSYVPAVAGDTGRVRVRAFVRRVNEVGARAAGPRTSTGYGSPK